MPTPQTNLTLGQLCSLSCTTDESSAFEAWENWLDSTYPGANYIVGYDSPNGQVKLAASSAAWKDKANNIFSENEHPLRMHAPLNFKGNRYGQIVLELPRQNENQDTLRVFIEALGHRLASIFLAQSNKEQVASANQIRSTIGNIASLFGNLESDVLLAKLLNLTLTITQAEVGIVVLTSPDNSIYQAVEFGIQQNWLESLATVDGKSLIETYLASDKVTLLDEGEFSRAFSVAPNSAKISTLGIAPLYAGDDLAGGLIFANSPPDQFNTYLSSLVCVSHLAAIEIVNAQERAQQQINSHRERELYLARSIQESLQVQDTAPIQGTDVDAWCLACDETGGDYVDIFESSSSVVELVLGDATGHGLGAAMVMVNVRASLLSLLQTGISLEQVFALLNERSEQDTNDERFMTLFYGRFDKNTRQLEYISAGHDCPLLLRSADMRVESLPATGLPLGMLPEQSYSIHKVTLDVGDRLLVFSDGVPEARNNAGQALGEEALVELIQHTQAGSAAGLSNAVRSLVLSHIGNEPRADDITVLTLVA